MTLKNSQEEEEEEELLLLCDCGLLLCADMSGSRFMRAIRVREFGAPSVLRLCPDVPVPQPGLTQVRDHRLHALLQRGQSSHGDADSNFILSFCCDLTHVGLLLV